MMDQQNVTLSLPAELLREALRARRCSAEVLRPEDLNDGQEYGGVVVRNPFNPMRAG